MTEKLNGRPFCSKENSDALKAAFEFARRAEKGLPSDRWTTGALGDLLVAKGIRIQAEMIEKLSTAFINLYEDQQARQRDSMSLGEPRKRCD